MGYKMPVETVFACNNIRKLFSVCFRYRHEWWKQFGGQLVLLIVSKDLLVKYQQLNIARNI